MLPPASSFFPGNSLKCIQWIPLRQVRACFLRTWVFRIPLAWFLRELMCYCFVRKWDLWNQEWEKGRGSRERGRGQQRAWQSCPAPQQARSTVHSSTTVLEGPSSYMCRGRERKDSTQAPIPQWSQLCPTSGTFSHFQAEATILTPQGGQASPDKSCRWAGRNHHFALT